MPYSLDPQPELRDDMPLETQILMLMAKVTDRFDSEENEGWQWIKQQSENPAVIEIMKEATPTTLRVLDAVGRLEPVNGITIAGQFCIPKGTVSKITRRLIDQNLMSKEALPNNKKEVLFRLTPLGRDIFRIHRDFDERMEKGFIAFLQRYTADELHFLIRVLGEASEASFLTLAQTSP